MSPLILASVGTYSGPPGSTLKPIVEGAQLWVKFANAKGGLAGHPVKLFVYDNGGDPARHKAQVQEAVEKRGVVAFLANVEVIVGGVTADYVAAKRIPVIGTEGGNDFPYDNGMYFLQQPSGATLYLTMVLSTAQLAIPKGNTKLGTLVCAEPFKACTDVERVFRERAGSVGLDLVYQGRASVAQPDYTAECLAARNAGVQVLYVILDSNSVSRLTGSCARQAYEPQYGLPSSIVQDRYKDDSHLDGVAGATNIFPWFQTGTPATEEFHQALDAYGGGMQPGAGIAAGWAAGKLLERAGGGLTQPPATASILRGLWTIKDDTLGGLTYPLTFTEGNPAARESCWFNISVKEGSWYSPDRFKVLCGQ